MLKSCKYCGRMHDINQPCPYAPRRKFKKTVQSEMRSTHKWQKKREEIKRRDLGMCQVCLDKGRLNYESLEAHHIVPIEEDGALAFEDGNIITLCAAHHKQAERGELSRKYLKSLIKEGV